MRLLLLVNPHSGRGRAKRLGEQAAQHAVKLGSTVEIIAENSAEESLAAADAAIRQASSTEPFDAIVVVGGDGSIHQSLALVHSHRIPLAVIASGTGNDLARVIKAHGKSAEKIIDVIHSQPPRDHDLGLVTSSEGARLFIQVLSTGFDSIVNERANGYRRLRGKIKYVVATFREIFTFKAKRFTFSVDGVEYQRDAMLLAVANGPNYGGGMQVVPMADPRDGKLHLLLLKTVPTLEFLRVFPSVFAGKHITHKAVEIFSGTRVDISADVTAYADGERVGRLPISITVLPNAIKVWNI